MESKNLNWLEDYRRIKRNPVFFIEEYYNQLHSDGKVCLTDEEKQIIYDKHRVNMVPLLDEIDIRLYNDYRKKIDDLKKQGYKDWEIF
jgi:hypothetical protein